MRLFRARRVHPNQRFRKGAGGESDERLVCPLAEVVNRPRDDAFACPAFSGDEHTSMDASNFANYFVHLLHRFAVAEQSFHMHGRKKFLGSGQVSSQSRATAGAIQGKFQSLNIKRLFQEVDCAIPQCLYGLFTSAFPAESNDGRSRFPL